MSAPRLSVYTALLNPDAIARWRVPAGMSCQVHQFDAREGGSFRISLTYDSPSGAGKSTSQTDTYHGRFATLVPNEQVVEVVEFETADPALSGNMTITRWARRWHWLTSPGSSSRGKRRHKKVTRWPPRSLRPASVDVPIGGSTSTTAGGSTRSRTSSVPWRTPP